MERSRLFGMVFAAGLLFCLVLPIMPGPAFQTREQQVASNRDLIGALRVNLPDLLVKEIGLSKNCELTITIANNGSAGVPDFSYSGNKSVSIQFFMGHNHAFTIELRVLDPKGKLKSPGGTVTYVWAPIIASKQFDLDSPKIKVVVDPNNVLREANETNNELTKEVICKEKASIEIYAVDPPKADFICWYRGAGNTYGILWNAVNYGYTTIEKITLTCIENWDQEPYVPCHIVTTIGNNAPNTGSFFFQLPPATIHTGSYEIRVYGHGRVVSNVFMYCIF